MTAMIKMKMMTMLIIIFNELKKRFNLHMNDVSSGGQDVRMGELTLVALVNRPPATPAPIAEVVPDS